MPKGVRAFRSFACRSFSVAFRAVLGALTLTRTPPRTKTGSKVPRNENKRGSPFPGCRRTAFCRKCLNRALIVPGLWSKKRAIQSRFIYSPCRPWFRPFFLDPWTVTVTPAAVICVSVCPVPVLVFVAPAVRPVPETCLCVFPRAAVAD